jgi:hypothetical protein
MSERRLSAFESRLVGRPDLITSEDVMDFKTGVIFEEEGGELVKAAYIRQLKIYGCLVHESFGWWPKRGVLFPMGGEAVAVSLHPNECLTEALRAVALLESYNVALLERGTAVDLAAPSVDSCRWCPFQVICPAFWKEVTTEWRQADGLISLEGVLKEDPQLLQGGGYRIVVSVTGGMVEPCTLELAPLDPSTHEALGNAKETTGIRVTGLRARSDGSIVPTKRTIIISEDQIPTIIVALNEGQDAVDDKEVF